MFDRLIEMCKNGETLTQENVGEGMFVQDRGCCQLIIPQGNSPEHGYYFINSVDGHDCFSYNSESTHLYHVLDGEGIFIIDDETFEVKEGDTILINPNKVFAYKGKMLLTLEMMPDFKQENDHFVSKIDYSQKRATK